MRIFGGLALLALPLFANVAVAHPKLSDEQLAEYHANQARTTKALHRCLEAPHMKGIKARMVEEREASFKHVLKARGIETNEGKSPAIFSDYVGVANSMQRTRRTTRP